MNQVRISELINPTDKQRQFLAATKTSKYVLYGGAAGGGKSYILRWWLVLFLLTAWARWQLKHVRVGLFCEDYPSLKDRQLSKIASEFPPWLGELKETKEEGLVFRLRDEYGAGIISPRNLDDPAKYHSVEFAAIAVDELTRNPQSVFDQLRARLRWPGFPADFVFPFAAGAMPGGIGHAWVKRLWVAGDPPDELKGATFAFLPARASDNPHLAKQYYDDLLTLPTPMRKAYAEGNWDVFAGQYFALFDLNRHVIRTERIGAEPWWPRWISMDWGFEHESAIHWHTRAPDGRIITYREYVVNHLSAPTLGTEIAARSHGENIGAFYLGWDAFAQRRSEHTIAEEIGEAVARADLPLPMKADDDRVGGWRLMYEMLESGKWLIADSCPALIACLPTLVRDEAHVEDVAKTDGDDPADSARYGLKSYLQSTQMPRDEQWVRQAAALRERVPEININSLIVAHKIWEREHPQQRGTWR